MITCNLTEANLDVKIFKQLHNIEEANAHLIGVDVWKHQGDNMLKLECRVSIFLNDHQCVQGTGPTFTDALQKIAQKLRHSHITVSPKEPVVVTLKE